MLIKGRICQKNTIISRWERTIWLLIQFLNLTFTGICKISASWNFFTPLVDMLSNVWAYTHTLGGNSRSLADVSGLH